MNVESFFKSLLPNLERKRVVEDLDQLREEIDKTVLPKLKEAEALLAGRRLASTYAINFDKLFGHALPDYRNHNFFSGAQHMLGNVKANLATIEKLLPDMFGKDITKESVTYPKAAVLQYIQLSSFVVDYTLRAMYRVVTAEVMMAQSKGQDIDTNLTAAEKKWFTENEQTYFSAIKVVNVRSAEFVKMLEKIPQLNIVPENGDLLRQTVASSELDPFRFGFISAGSWNLLYQVRLVYAEAQVKRYRQKLEEKRALEYRLLQWKEAQAGKNDARLAQEIEYSEGRLQRLNVELRELLERYETA